tara:strand:+ start:246 stop:488 length:243 start_codon:yes stop_codon:yes gene_type:complete
MIDFDHDPTQLRDRLFISMSAHFLTEQLPDEAIDWDEDQIEKFCEDHVWQPLEYVPVDEVVEMIESAAHHAFEFFRKELS